MCGTKAPMHGCPREELFLLKSILNFCLLFERRTAQSIRQNGMKSRNTCHWRDVSFRLSGKEESGFRSPDRGGILLGSSEKCF